MDIKKLIKPGNNTPAVNIVRRDPQFAAAVSKIEKDSRNPTRYGQDGNIDMDIFSISSLQNLSSKRARRNSDAQAILKLLPDINLSKQILISCILSPKDMTSTELRFLIPNNLFNPELSGAIINRIKTYFEENYEIEKVLTLMLEEALFDKGSYPIAVLPESAIDEMINGQRSLSTESFKTLLSSDLKTFAPLGILGSPIEAKNNQETIKTLSTENFAGNNIIKPGNFENSLTYDNDILKGDGATEPYTIEPLVSITDNFSILKLPKLARSMLSETIENIYSNYSSSQKNLSQESFNISELKDIDVDKLINRNRHHQYEQVTSIKSQYELNRKTIGEPLVMKLPSESVIPVHAPGDVRKQICFFVLLDQDGNPIEIPDGDHDYSNLNSNTNGNMASSLVNRVATNFNTTNFRFDNNNQQHVAQAAKIYGKLIEKDLLTRLRNGVYNSNLEITSNEEVYRLMLSRVLAKKFTQILMIPAEYMTYIAFKYDDNGMGKSLLDDAMTINTLRAVIMFTDIIGQIKNAVGRTKVTVNVPENDPNVSKTIEKIVDEIVRSRTVSLPGSVANPNDIVEFIQRVGYEFNFTGHPGLPDLKIDFEQVNNSYQKVDDTLSDNLKNASLAQFGLTPEVVTNGLNQPDFATTIVANNILLSKRVSNIQDIFAPLLSDHIRKVARNSELLAKDLKEIISNKIDGIKLEIDDFLAKDIVEKLTDEVKEKILIKRAYNDLITGMYVELPKPDSVTLEKQFSDLDNYSNGLEKVLDAYISESLFTNETAGDISNQVNTIRAQIKAYYIRKYLSEKGMFTEIADLTNTDEDGKPLLDLPQIVKDHLSSLTKTGIATLLNIKQFIDKSNEFIKDSLGNLEEETVTSDGSSSSFSSSSDSDFGGGFDDFGSGDLTDTNSGDDLVNTEDEETSDKEDSKSDTDSDFTPPETGLET